MDNSFSAGPAIPLDAYYAQSHTRNSTNLSTPTTPFQPQQPMTQQKTYSNMFDKISHARTLAGAKADPFYTDGDVNNHSPLGWPSIGAAQMYSPNFNSHRVYNSLTHQTLTFYELRIHCIEDKLDEINLKGNVAQINLLTSLPFDKERFLARCLQGTGHLPAQPSETGTGEIDPETERENLMISLGILLREYFTLLHMQHDNRKFARVSRCAHEAHFRVARNFHRLDDKACAFMRYMDDFITTEPDYIFQRFESLLYTNSSWVKNILKHICCISGDDSPPAAASSADDPRVAYSLRPFELLFKGLLALVNLALLIIPVSLLYLETGWSRGQYLAIIAVFSTIFAFAIAAFEPRTAHLLVGLSAFFAVLVTFLSNLPGSGCTVA